MRTLKEFLDERRDADEFVVYVRDKKFKTLSCARFYKATAEDEMHPTGLNVLAIATRFGDKATYVYCTNSQEASEEDVKEAEKTLAIMMKG